MIFKLLFSLLFAQNLCDQVIPLAPDYQALDARIQKKIADASNLAPVASEADSVLSKLIAAKSPILLDWLKKRELMSAKEETIAKEWRKYYLDNFILSRYPSDNKRINNGVENLFLEIANLAFPKVYQQKIEKLLVQVQKDAKAMVENWPIEPTQQKQIIQKIASLKLYWFEKLQGTRFEQKPLEFVRWGVAYDPIHHEINMGVLAKRYPSDANLYAVLAHEMGHAMDPCRWGAYFNGPSPFTKLHSCLRQDKSVAAKKRDDSQMQQALKSQLLTPAMAQSLKENPTCNRSFYPAVGVQKDQLAEAFADWFSAEVFAKSTFLGQHPRPDLCASNELQAGSSYLPNHDRLAKIYGAQPLIAAKWKTPTPPFHCPL